MKVGSNRVNKEKIFHYVYYFIGFVINAKDENDRHVNSKESQKSFNYKATAITITMLSERLQNRE